MSLSDDVAMDERPIMSCQGQKRTLEIESEEEPAVKRNKVPLTLSLDEQMDQEMDDASPASCQKRKRVIEDDSADPDSSGQDPEIKRPKMPMITLVPLNLLQDDPVDQESPQHDLSDQYVTPSAPSMFDQKRINAGQQPNNMSLSSLEGHQLMKGLATALPNTNKGFSIMSKMGYKVGLALGRTGQGITEPLDIYTDVAQQNQRAARKDRNQRMKLARKLKKTTEKEEVNLAFYQEKSHLPAACLSQMEMVNDFLRITELYCHWCGVHYFSLTDMWLKCPGGKEDH